MQRIEQADASIIARTCGALQRFAMPRQHLHLFFTCSPAGQLPAEAISATIAEAKPIGIVPPQNRCG